MTNKNKLTAVLSLVFVSACSSQAVTTTTTSSLPIVDKNVTLVAVGDIACSSAQRSAGKYPCQDIEVANLARNLEPDYVLALGDIQYNNHSQSDFNNNFGKYWSSLILKVKPILGNHEYYQPGAKGFFSSWDWVPENGYYSFDLNGLWRVIAINTNDDCRFVYCGEGSDQYKWLEAELQSSADKCVIVIGHHPRYSSGPHGDSFSVADVYSLMERYRVVAYLSGHDHHYERFSSTVPQYVVGTGGKDLRSIRVDNSQPPYSQHSSDTHHGVLFIELTGTTASTRFIATDGVTMDTHTLQCSKGEQK